MLFPILFTLTYMAILFSFNLFDFHYNNIARTDINLRVIVKPFTL